LGRAGEKGTKEEEKGREVKRKKPLGPRKKILHGGTSREKTREIGLCKTTVREVAQNFTEIL